MISIGIEPKQPRFDERIGAFSQRLSPEAFSRLSRVATTSVDFINSMWQDDSEHLGPTSTPLMEYATSIINTHSEESRVGIDFAKDNHRKLSADIISEFMACGVKAKMPELLTDEERKHLDSALSRLDVISDQTSRGIQLKSGRFAHLIENYFSQDKVLLKHDVALRIAEALSNRFDNLSKNSLLYDPGTKRPGLFHRIQRQQYDGISQLQSERINALFGTVPNAESVFEDHIRGVTAASMRNVYGYEKIDLAGSHGINDRVQIDSFQRNYILKNGYYMIALTPKEWARLMQDVTVGELLYGDGDVASFLDARAAQYEDNERVNYYNWNNRDSRRSNSYEYRKRLQKNKILVDEIDVDYSSSETYNGNPTYRTKEDVEPEKVGPNKFESWSTDQIGIFGDFVRFIDAKFAEKSARDTTLAAAVSTINHLAFKIVEDNAELNQLSSSRERNKKILRHAINILHPDRNPQRSDTSDEACKYANALFTDLKKSSA